MPHVAGKIRVKRKGTGPMAVTTDSADKKIGDQPRVLEWIKRPAGDSDPGDDFVFNKANPLEGLPANLFTITKIEDRKVTVSYAGYQGAHEWQYLIHVTDAPDKGHITSDGSATIKNH